jgi:pimeloyl-ACP methyl ester carboxylesterase
MSNRHTFHLMSSLMLAGLFVFTTGCTLMRAKKDLVVRNETVRISGVVTSAKPTTKPLCVALYAETPSGQRKKLTACQVVYKDGTFSFQPKAGDYYLFAFEDANEDGTFQFTERVGWHGEPSLFSARPGEILDTFKLALRPPEQARKELPLLYTNGLSQVEMRIENRHVGTVTSLSDPRFDPETGVLGMWEPATFFERYGGGLFFLQPYEEGKTPVLFFHGVGGTPRNFESLISKLDRSRFQPWIVHYPSGIRLTLLADYFAKLINEVKIHHKTPRIIIVAHSMGGLVARGAINRLTADGKTFVPLFVSISSPWQGHPGAGAGVEHSPVILPCWFDMSPGSPYLDALQKTPLPLTTSYYLLFGYRGGRAAFADGNTDGTLPISSMLDLGMQESAVNVFGFNENHVSILHSTDVSARLNRILEKVAR